jgi:hypothetical protein
MLDFPISSSGSLSSAVRALGLSTFAEVAEHVRALPYGRVTAGDDVLSVLRAGRGTCSSKHRFLAALAAECHHPDFRLTLGLYAMCERNTPGVGRILSAAGVDAIPEAHCYVTVGGERYDFTGLPSGTSSPFAFLIDERTIAPNDLPALKLRYHREALARWASAVGMDPERAWRLREQCITHLADLERTP